MLETLQPFGSPRRLTFHVLTREIKYNPPQAKITIGVQTAGAGSSREGRNPCPFPSFGIECAAAPGGPPSLSPARRGLSIESL